MNATESRAQEFSGHELRDPAYATHPSAAMRDSRLRSPALAAAFSALPGLGQIYVGYYPRGFVNSVVAGGIISILAWTTGEAAYVPLLALFLAFFWLYNMIDAARLAALYNRALSGGREPDLPAGFAMPGLGGSIVGGLAVIAAALIALLHTRFGVPLDWLNDWWPVVPMLFGVWLVVKAVKDSKTRPMA
ncbi:MAG TPA: hypothetical protein VFV19_18355 [Candidatus Polarisedimenticolaceae bacterium]|nr:hypothetical protein [Candidatus Polarisedimenticolaceae bacterium]